MTCCINALITKNSAHAYMFLIGGPNSASLSTNCENNIDKGKILNILHGILLIMLGLLSSSARFQLRSFPPKNVQDLAREKMRQVMHYKYSLTPTDSVTST